MTCCAELPCIFKWNDLKQTGLAAVAVNALLITMLASKLSIIYILTSFALVSTLSVIGYLFVSKFLGGSADATNESQLQEHVSEETVQGFVICLVNLNNKVKAYFGELHKSVSSQIKMIVSLYAASKLVGCFSLPLLALLVIDGTLAYGFVTRVLKIDVCALTQPHIEKVKGLVQLGLNLIPRYEPTNSQ